MAELAAGAVSSLLGVIRNEALLLRRVGDDVQFIKEEMESMNSFLAHLARSAPPGSEHDEQVRTWMNQVRLLAQDCNNCIDLYLYRRNPDIHHARGGLWRYLWWVPWFLQKLVAQHHAAIQLGQLKERARDVGERRLRYGVEVPTKLAAEQASPRVAGRTAAAAAGGDAAEDDDEEDGVNQLVVATATEHSGRRAFFEPCTLYEYVKAKLLEWFTEFPANAKETISIAIVAPDTDPDALALAHETLVFQPDWDNTRAGYHRAVLVDIPAVHPDFLPLRPKEILYYILRELKLEHSKSQPQEQAMDQGEEEEDEELDSWQVYYKKLSIYREKKRTLHKIKESIKKMKIYEKLDKIKSEIRVRPMKGLGQKKGKDPLDLDIHGLLQLLFQSASQEEHAKIKDMYKLPVWNDSIITKIAKKLKEYMEADEKGEEPKEQMGFEGEKVEEHEEKEDDDHDDDGDDEYSGEDDDDKQDEDEENEDDEERQQMAPIHLHEDQYAHILRVVFPKTTSSKPLQAQQQDRLAAEQPTKTILGEDQVKEMIHKAKQEILRELQEGKYDKKQMTAEPGIPIQNTEVVFAEIEQKMDKIEQEFKEQLKIKGLVDEINHHLKGDCPLFILKADETMDTSRWEDTRNALSLLGCSADALIVTATKDTQRAKQYCYPEREPIDYSLVGLYHYTVLELTSQQKNEDNYNPQIFRDILEECEPHEFCMKIFTHALYANPKRSNEELTKLCSTLQILPKSFDIIAKKMLKFSYSDLSKEYKSCLLYLAIFPPGYKVRRSTLIGRWVAEGLIFKEDWPSSVRQANRCFDALINRRLVYPADIGATGKVKSCVVGDLVHGFITKIARKQHIVETRLSRHLARHFSVFNDLQLRSSDGIDKFFRSLSKSSRVSLLKVLDLEGCHCFGGKNKRYLKDICNKMLLLKYLSLRGTDITQLPSEINNLRELEVLDIRQTKVPASATVNILLLKLKRFLAGHINQSPRNSDTNRAIGADGLVSSVQIPHKMEKMVNMEVLSNVKVRSSQDLKDIGKLWQLRKLGVVIDDRTNHLKNLLRMISDLHECLRSLSITLPLARSEDIPPGEELPDDIGSCLKLRHPPNLLETLSISGTTRKGHLLPLFAKDGNNKLAKVTLSRTSLNQDNLKVLAKLPKLQCVRLRHIACTESMLTFKEGEFKYLKYLLVEGSNLREIVFEEGAAPELEEMVLSFTSIGSVSGVGGLKKLEVLELNNNNNGRLLSSFDNAKQITKLTLRGTLLEQGALQILAKKPNMRCLVLLDSSCEVSQITLSKDDFPKLNHLIVHCSAITEIVFTGGSAPKLKKIIWSSTTLSGINNLPRLKELEFNGDPVPNEMKEAVKKHKNRPSLKHNKPENHDQAKGDEQEDDNDAARFSFCWKNQV